MILRKKNKHKINGILLLLTGSVFFISCTQQKDVISFEAMSTYITIQSFGKKAELANKAVKKRILELESIISTTNSQSDVYRINNTENKDNQKLSVQNETFRLLDFSTKMAEKTDGALNPALYPITKAWGFTTGNYTVPDSVTIDKLLTFTDFNKIQLFSDQASEEFFVMLDNGMQLDFGAVGKGFAGDEAIKILKSYKIKSALLDLGGNIQTIGKKTDGTDWRVGIKNPWDGSSLCGISISDKSVVTSGGYERFFTGDDGNDYIHIFDPKNGYPVNNDCASVSIITEQGLYADALSTALFVMGSKKALEFWRKYKDFGLIIVTNEGKILYTENIKQDLIKGLSSLEMKEIK